MFEQRLLVNEIVTIKSISSLIREGQFSKVYDATCNLNKRVALKIIFKEAVEGLKNKYEEGLNQLQHGNICNVVSAGILQDGRVYYSFEFVEGGSLQDKINDVGCLILPEIITLSIGTLRGLIYLNKNNILHGDLKPGNILITKTGKAIITDFGLALSSSNSSANNSIVYNTHRSPEFAESKLNGSKYNKTIADDIYAFGVTLYRMINGNHSFTESIDNPELLRLIATGKFPDRNNFPPYLDKRLMRIVKKALDVRLTHRYTSFEQIESDIKRIKSSIYWSKINEYEYHGFNDKTGLKYRLLLIPYKRGNLKGSFKVELKRGKIKNNLKKTSIISFPAVKNIRSYKEMSELFKLVV